MHSKHIVNNVVFQHPVTLYSFDVFVSAFRATYTRSLKTKFNF
jgi:hypothetical protein